MQMTNNHDIGQSFNKLLGEMHYKYRGYRALRLPNGNVRLMLNEMTKEQFHAEVDGWHDMLQASIERAFSKSINRTK